MTMRILVVEDDPDIAELVVRYLAKAGFQTERAANGRDALQALTAQPPDLMVLDLMLPHVDGIEICRYVRNHAALAALPIIMLTARAEESERIVGLELGADDYLPKPFSPGELVARVRALLRRASRNSAPAELPAGDGRSPRSGPLSYGPLVMNTDTHTVTDDNRPVSLTAKEFLLLQYLLTHRGRVLSRDVLLTDVWGYRYTGGTRTVDVHVRRLREKMPFLGDALITIKQFGYKLADPAPVRA
jgi:two-component system, OmpR family, alkaline phosphatase synthesis response regulator PhoP